MNDLEKMRHTLSHVLAAAVKEIYPTAKLGIGPAIDNGFYYDFDHAPFSREDLDKIEAEMSEWKKQDEDVLSYALFPQVAGKFLAERNSGATAKTETKSEDGERVLYVDDATI